MFSKGSLLFCLIFMPTIVFSQPEEFVELSDGTILNGKVEVKKTATGGSLIVFNDSAHFVSSQVKGFKDKNGYFVRVSTWKGNKFARLTKKGNIELYETVEVGTTYGYSSGDYWVYDPQPYTKRTVYFSKSSGEIWKANVPNLKKAFSDNPKAMRELNNLQMLQIATIGLLVGGAAIVAASFATLKKNSESPPAAIFIGTGIALSSWLPHLAKKGKKEKAIEIYNITVDSSDSADPKRRE